MNRYLLLLSALFTMKGLWAMEENQTSFAFQRLNEADLPLLFNWFKQPYIAQLWKEPQEWDAFQAKFIPRLSSSDSISFIAHRGNNPLGYIQYHYVTDEDRALFPDIVLPPHSIGLDLFIGEPECLNKGYGTLLLAAFIEFLTKREPLCTTMIIDPAPDNLRAIKCYEKVGFKKVGNYQTPYGPTGEGPGKILLMIRA